MPLVSTTQNTLSCSQSDTQGNRPGSPSSLLSSVMRLENEIHRPPLSVRVGEEPSSFLDALQLPSRCCGGDVALEVDDRFARPAKEAIESSAGLG